MCSRTLVSLLYHYCVCRTTLTRGIVQYAKSHWDTFGIAQSGDTFDTILNAYMQLGEHMPKLRKHRFQFQTQPQMTNILVLIYGNILKYHRNVLFTYRKFCFSLILLNSYTNTLQVTIGTHENGLSSPKKL